LNFLWTLFELLDKNAVSEHSWFRGYNFSSYELDFSPYGKTYTYWRCYRI